MKRPATLMLFVLAVAAGGILFGVAFKVSALEDQLIGLNKQITQDRDAIHVLRAEWSYLNQPERLDGLSQRYLELQPLEGDQFSEIAALPVRPAPDPSTDPLPSETAPSDPALAQLASTAPADTPSTEMPIAIPISGTPKLKPAAPRRPSRHVRLASQRNSPQAAAGTTVSDKAALDAALRVIFGTTARHAGGAPR